MSAALEAAARLEMLEGDPALAWSLGRAIVAERRLGDGSGDVPEYYRLGDGLDVGDVLEALGWAEGYWRGSVLAHLVRAGKKTGESELEAIENALGCLRRERDRVARKGVAS